MNVWYPIEEVLKIIQLSRAGKWHWGCNSKLKYLNLRVDMRDGHCRIFDRNDNPVELEELMENQERWTKETNDD